MSCVSVCVLASDLYSCVIDILFPTKYNIKKSLKIPRGVIRILKSKKNRQTNDQKKKDKRTNNDLQNIHIKLKIE